MLFINSSTKFGFGRNSRPFYLIFLTAVLSSWQPAQADLGKINLYMRATLVANTCSVSANSINKTVNLGVWAIKQFVETPTLAPPVSFTVNLEDCGPAASGIRVSWQGVSQPSNSELFALTSDSTATNVGVELLDWNRHRIQPGATTPAYGVTANASSVSIPFYARYVRAGGSVTAGTANSMATFTLDYL